MHEICDYIQVFFWAVTYILVICYSLKNKRIGIPVIALSTNFAWETIAVFRDITVSDSLHIAIILWLVLDLVIVIVYLLCCKTLYFNKLIFVLIYAVELLLFYYLMELPRSRITVAFVIDMTMAVEWFIYAFNQEYNADQLSMCFLFTKLIGSSFAWIGYIQYHPVVSITGVITLLFNIGSIIVMMRKRKKMPAC